ncbi:unnamed protein product [Nyctereutes procyonoides]|uniref:(raccoon dog) hypothetical protein n=1 Tax=Nyctereutes procyonoides TaxID=34880 RepID=A0A811YN25_NYCPR|nr:unnamed protein product [Nyctereutes procyonoides]
MTCHVIGQESSHSPGKAGVIQWLHPAKTPDQNLQRPSLHTSLGGCCVGHGSAATTLRAAGEGGVRMRSCCRRQPRAGQRASRGRQRGRPAPRTSRLASWGPQSTSSKAFRSEYPEGSMDVKPIAREEVETKKALRSQCRRPARNISCRPAYDQDGPDATLPLLHLGSTCRACKCELLANTRITALLCVSQRTLESCMVHLRYKWIPSVGFTKSGKGEARLGSPIHTPSACMAYLMKTKQFCLKDAFDHIQQRRSAVFPKFGFIGQQLLRYDSLFMAHLQMLSPDMQGSYCTFPTSVMVSVPIHSAGASWPQPHPTKTGLGELAQPQQLRFYFLNSDISYLCNTEKLTLFYHE